MSGTLLGHVFNRQLAQQIPVYLSQKGNGWVRLTEPIDPQIKAVALGDAKDGFESGSIFTDEAMKSMRRLVITNMIHPSEGDGNPHYSMHGEDGNGEKIAGGHVQVDKSKQTRAK